MHPGDLTIEPLARVHARPLHDLNVVITDRTDGLHLEFEYDTARLDRATVEKMLSHYERLLQSVVANPSRRISAAPALPESGPRARRAERKVVTGDRSIRPYLGLQLQLIAIWEDLLAVRGIGIRDNFFDLGGTSLQFLRMLQRAEAACGKAILPVAFFAEPTIENLALEIAQAAMDESSSLLKLNETGTRTPFFYLHGDLFGGGFYSQKLSRALGPEQPFYVMPPQDVRALPTAPTIEEMAAKHRRALRGVRPHGPYFIGGFCLGGLVAYELAQQLIHDGEKVEMLLVIDAAPEDKTLRVLRDLTAMAARLLRWSDAAQIDHFRQWALRRTQFSLWYEEKVPEKMRLVTRQIRHRLVSAFGLLQRQVRNGNRAGDLEAELSQERDVPSAFLWASAGYRPRPYPGRMSVLLSEDLLHRGDDLARAWQQLAPKVTVHPLTGSHLECITAHVDNLAETIEHCLPHSGLSSSEERSDDISPS